MTERIGKPRNIYFRLTVALILSAFMSIAVLTTSQGARAQERPQNPQPATAPAAPERPAVSNLLMLGRDDYRIGVGDVLEISIADAPDLSGSVQVRSDGTILNRYLGRVMARDKTADELSKEIADGLRGRYLVNPYVRVEVKQFNSRTFFIQGSVNRPGVYQIEGKASLLELITLAGGLNKDHGSTAYIIRRIKPKDTDAAPEAVPAKDSGSDEEEVAKYELIRAKISGLMLGDFDQNIPVEPYDIVTIPPTDIFFIGGEVRAPGSFPLKEGTTLRQAISLAQGMKFEAAKSRGMIFREVNGKRQEIPVNIEAVMNGKKEDILLMPNDVIIVPNSRARSVGATILRAFGVSSIRVPFLY